MTLRRILQRSVSWSARKAAELVPAGQLQRWLVWAAIFRARALSPAEGLRFLFEVEAEFYSIEGQLAVAYDAGIHTKHRHTRYHDFFVQRVGENERVLDIGCGIGALAYEVADQSNAFVLGIDVSASSIAKAQERYPHRRVEYRVGDALQAVPDGAFDVVILSNVLEHLGGRSAFLDRLKKAARPSRILVRVPLYERDWRVPLKKELGVDWRLDPSHETEYTLESFEEEMEAASLTITHQEVRWGEIWAEVVPDAA